MTQVHFRKAGSGDYIKDWPMWTGVVPAFPDLVVLHYGDDNEEEKRYRVEGREISGTEPDDVTIYLSEYPSNQCNLTDEEIEDLRQEIRRESERLSAEHNPALDLTIEDCKDDMSIRAFNICRKNGIRTLRDLTLLHKTDWLKFRNSGKRSLECIDDLLTKHGLTWAKYETR